MLPALRTDPSQYLHQRAGAASGNVAAEATSANMVRGTDLRGRGIRGIDCHGLNRGDACFGADLRLRTESGSAKLSFRIAGPLCNPCQLDELPAGQYHV